jgi:two-component system, cell cycle response regulator CpdR
VTGSTQKLGARALVVDDEELVRNLIARVAREHFETVTVAAGGQEALTALAAAAFDLVITDLRMPDVDGLAVVQWLSAHQSGTPVIAITGFADAQTERAVEALGARLLHKPFGTRELRDAIGYALRGTAKRAPERPET